MIENYMRKIARHTAVYWGTATTTGEGYNTFATAKEIKCFWKEGSENIVLRTGREVTSLATVYVLEDLDESGMLYLGSLADLSTAQINDPRQLSNAYEIRIPWKTPALSMANQYVRKIALTK